MPDLDNLAVQPSGRSNAQGRHDHCRNLLQGGGKVAADLDNVWQRPFSRVVDGVYHWRRAWSNTLLIATGRVT